MRKLSALIAFSASLLVVGAAQAAEVDDGKKAPDQAAAGKKPESEFKSVSLTLNPLSLILTRIGVNVEYLPAPHHAIMLNPYGQFVSVGSDQLGTKYTNLGAELGYHFYTGSKGANGFFVGPSLVYMHSSAKTTGTSAGVTNSVEASISAYGVAVDLGGQHVFDNGFTIGGGAGVMYLTAADTSNLQTSSTVKVSGVLPRFLFTVGYSF
jgi:hypothetical protein